MERKKPVIGITLDIDGEYLRLRHQYPSAIIKAGGMAVLIPIENDPHSVADEIDGLLIPGGDDIDPYYYSEELLSFENRIVPRERTDFEIALLEAIMKLRKPVMGICYGMQLINVALGGSLYQDIGSQLDIALDHRKGNHRISGSGDFISGQFMVSSSHHQAVKRVGSGLAVSAVSQDDLVEAIQMKGYPFLIGVQWHPERSNDVLSANLLRSFVEKANELK